MPKSVEYLHTLTIDLRLRNLIKKLRAVDNLIRRYISRHSRRDIHRDGRKECEEEYHESAPLSAVLSVTLKPRTVPHERKSSNYRPAPIFRIFRIARAKDRFERVRVEKEPRGCSIISIERRGVGHVLKMGVNTRDNLHSVIW